MKKIIIVTALAASLAGCATSGPNQTIGTGVGALGGYGVARAMGAGSAGSAVGAVAGALIGNEVGRNMDQNNGTFPRERVIVQERPVYVREPVVQCHIERQYDPRWNVYRDVRVCRRY
jgi:osmotically inducible lipoprotein OsmB